MVYYRFLFYLFRQWQLQQNTVYLVIGIELINQLHQLILCGGIGQLVLKTLHTRLGGLLAFVAHINLTGGILSNEYYCKTGHNIVFGL